MKRQTSSLGKHSICNEVPNAKQDIKKQKRETVCPIRYIKEGLDVSYTNLFEQTEADYFLKKLETGVKYYSGTLSRVKIFGKWIDIPRRQAAYGDEGLSYKFSGNTIPARPWNELPTLTDIKARVEETLDNKWRFNFVLINRYKDGNDYMGEHRDDEKDLDLNAPIASVSFGETRDFVLKHKDNRGGRRFRSDLSHVTIALQHGSLLVMHPPTNKCWYHSLPKRKLAKNPRVNLTFRVMST